MTDAALYSEFTQYPELTAPQQEILRALGLALFGVQGTESKLKFLLSFVFPNREDSTLAELCETDKTASKATLGMLIARLRERTEVTDEFEAMLTSFLKHRNRFVQIRAWSADGAGLRHWNGRGTLECAEVCGRTRIRVLAY